MLADWAVQAASRLIRGRFRQPTEYWRHRMWDGVLAEQHYSLGSAYRAERAAVTRILRHVAPNRCILDVASGTGRYTFAALDAGARHVTAMDVSTAALAELQRRAEESGFKSRVATLNADMWCESPVCHCGRRFDVVMCLDAIHHLGSLLEVVTRLSSFAASEGVLIGDIWTLDHYGEFQRLRRSWIEHLVTSFGFTAAVIWWRLWRGHVPASVRSELRQAEDVANTLVGTFGPEISVEIDRYWLRFATSITLTEATLPDDM
jgi:2-polyprenyl-3-methyl-5-hydroxy-6-metoxy-1,4-benzoquinol methylase